MTQARNVELAGVNVAHRKGLSPVMVGLELPKVELSYLNRQPTAIGDLHYVKGHWC